MATYTEDGRTVEVQQVGGLSKAEVRLFYYFLLKKPDSISDKKAKEFQGYLDGEEMPEEMGTITRKKNQAFCIRETHLGYYVVYVSMDEETPIHKRIHRVLEKVKK